MKTVVTHFSFHNVTILMKQFGGYFLWFFAFFPCVDSFLCASLISIRGVLNGGEILWVLVFPIIAIPYTFFAFLPQLVVNAMIVSACFMFLKGTIARLTVLYLSTAIFTWLTVFYGDSAKIDFPCILALLAGTTIAFFSMKKAL